MTALATVAPGVAFYQVTEALTVDTHSVTLSLANAAGISATRSWSFSVDDPAPNFYGEAPRDVFVAERQPRIRVLLSGFNIVASSIRISLDGADVTALAEVTANRVVLVPPGPLDDGVHTVSVAATDGRGVTGGKQWSFTVELPPPPATTEDGVRTERSVVPELRVLP